MGELIGDAIRSGVNSLLGPIRGGVVNGVRTVEAMRGNYVWTPDQMPWGGYGDRSSSQTVPGEIYQPHFYSGQDTFFFLVAPNGSLIALPVTSFGYGVSQQKAPVFGAWSYTHNGVLRGTRVVQGEFTIVFTKPNMIMQLVGAMVGGGSKPGAPLVHVDQSDEVKRRTELKQAMWNVGEDGMSAVYNPTAVSGGRISAYPFGQPAVNGGDPQAFAGHPGFDLLIVHGNDPNKINLSYDNWNAHTWAHSVGDHFKLMATDFNDISGSNFDPSDRVYIENVELMSSGIQYDMSGQPLQESYSFIAKDATTPAPASPIVSNAKQVVPFTDLLK